MKILGSILLVSMVVLLAYLYWNVPAIVFDIAACMSNDMACFIVKKCFTIKKGGV